MMQLIQSWSRFQENAMADTYSDPCVHGDLFVNESLARYTSWRVGGKADRLFRPRDHDGLVAFLRELPIREPVFWLGMGSNILIRDGGIRGTVIHVRGRLNEVRMKGENSVYAESGVLCPHLARFCSDQGLAGAEFFSGIPGSLGGALAMNAGAFGDETWPLVQEVVTVDRRGCCRVRARDEYQAGYRCMSGPSNEFFLTAKLKLGSEQGVESRRRIKTLLARRANTQPLNLPSCGSVFKNPPGDFAARLIEASGLKGYCIGGAAVSDKHANFIVNSNEARAVDIETLIEWVRREVERQHGVKLVKEVNIVGEVAGDEEE
jgi:UDP-N-acetylmuramate dehydrogenase